MGYRFRKATMRGFLGLALLAAASLRADEPYGRHQLDPAAREHWAFQAVRSSEPPTVDTRGWARNPIDQFIFAGLSEAKLNPTPPASRETLLRRVYLDLIGLPPTPAELAAFLADDGPGAFERVVDDLLARPQYGERWARHWLDVVRYAETNGYERDGLKPQAWRYRDWVIDALNADMPYDQFLTEQLAGDEVADSDADSQIATTMLRLGPWDDEPADALADRYDQLDDIVGTTSAAFLGLTLRCARCHDHKFEPFSQKDYTRWQAIFAPLKRPQEGRADLDRDVGPPAIVAAYQQRVKQLDGETTVIDDQARTLAWQICRQAAAEGRVALASETVAPDSTTAAPPPIKDLPSDALLAMAVEPVKRSDAQKKLLAKHAAKVQKLVVALASGEQREQIEADERKRDELKRQYPAPLVKGYIWFEEGPEFGASRVFGRGDPRNPGAEVGPGVPAVLVDAPPPLVAPTPRSTGRRLQLAHWLTSADHPLTARVLVNRLWQHHFGDGIVATENDFGVMGAAPSNQPLLDWLAGDFAAGGWRIKRMHRLMLLSAAYRMASTGDAAAERVDPQGALVWRFTPRRLEAETLRDTILAVSGRLNLTPRGPGIYPKISREVLETQSRPGSGWGASDASQAARRSVYVFIKRTLLVPELEVLDFPSTEETCEQRVTSTVAPQALTFLNGEFINEQAQAFAERLAREAGAGDEARIDLAYRLAFSRDPNEAEKTAVREFLRRHQVQIERESAGSLAGDEARRRALSALCLVLLNTNELAYLP